MKYWVTFEVYASQTVEVEASSEEQARERAYRKAGVSLCHECSRDIDIADIGEITNVEAVESGKGKADG